MSTLALFGQDALLSLMSMLKYPLLVLNAVLLVLLLELLLVLVVPVLCFLQLDLFVTDQESRVCVGT